MKRQKGDMELTAAILMVVVVLVAVMALSAIGCHARWGDMGFNVSYAPFKGCRMEVEKGKWLPVQSIRDVTITKEQKESK